MQCTKQQCKPLPPVSCDDPGFVPVQSLTQEDPCCVQTECRKNPLSSSMWKILYILWGTSETSFQHLICTLLSSYSAHLSPHDSHTFCIAFTRCLKRAPFKRNTFHFREREKSISPTQGKHAYQKVI